jgi:hypothetical protein
MYMVKASNNPLQPNPFTTYRDPKTGTWIVVKAASYPERYSNLDSPENLKPYNSL